MRILWTNNEKEKEKKGKERKGRVTVTFGKQNMTGRNNASRETDF
jgi:hypothetical protein